MRVSVDWLKKYVATDATPEVIADKLTMSGTEVEDILPMSPGVTKVVIGHITEMVQHPNADRLRICTIEVGQEAPLQIVTGAPNAAVGQKVMVALDGATLANDVHIKTGKLRGVESCGMLCSGEELGHPELDEVYGIYVLPEDAPVGADALNYLGLDDIILDCKAYANRPDCMSVVGVAREAAAVLDAKLELPCIEVKEEGEGAVADHIKVTVEAPELCPRYMARVFTGIKIAPSPLWMQKCLRAAGMRPINNMVDITNYVMLEMGQPLHAFDINYLKGGTICVRRAKDGENITTLDEKERALNSNMLVIADGEKPVAVAGIMGGENSGILDTTETVVLESAMFIPQSVRATSRTLGLRTESSARFEKGVDIVGTEKALNRAAQLVEELCMGKVEKGYIDICAEEVKSIRTIVVDPKRIRALLGLDIENGLMVDILARLQISASLEGDMLRVDVPSWRGDIACDADVAEEVLRIYGFDHVKPTLMNGTLVRGGLTAEQRAAERLKDVIVNMGFYETISYSFIGMQDMDKLGYAQDDPRRDMVAIRNPLGADYGYMRNTLAAAMLNIVSYNVNRHTSDALSLFEMSKTFWKREGELLPEERATLCLAQWNCGDFFTLKGVVEAIGAAFGMQLRFKAGGDEMWHSGRKALILHDGKVIGQMGEVAAATAEAYDVSGRVYLAEIFTDAIVTHDCFSKMKPLPKVAPIRRDLAVTVAEEVPVGDMEDTMTGACGKALSAVRVFDVYRSAQLGEGVKSVAFALTFGGDVEVDEKKADKLFQRVVQQLEQAHNAKIRS